MGQLTFDRGMAERMEVLYGTRDVRRRRRLVREAIGAAPGERVLDVGCGPGFTSAELLDDVGAEGSLVGVDLSEDMLAIAASRCTGRPATFRHADATSLPLPDRSFDAAVAVQVLEYVTDVGAALAEVRRVLRPGGRVLVWDVDWATVSWHSADPARMARVLDAWDGHLAHRSLPRVLGPALRTAGFTAVGMEAHAFATPELTLDAYGAAILPLIRDYVASSGTAAAGDVEAWAAEQQALGAAGEFFFACIQCCFTASVPPG
ncbi:MAG: methyltransferase domain-containing protein [Actinomycetota bacterium]